MPWANERSLSALKKANNLVNLFIDELAKNRLNARLTHIAEFEYNPRMILGLRPANESRRYTVTPSLIDWAKTLNQPCNSLLEVSDMCTRWQHILPHTCHDFTSANTNVRLCQGYEWHSNICLWQTHWRYIYIHFDEKVEWRDDWVLIVLFKHHDK